MNKKWTRVNPVRVIIMARVSALPRVTRANAQTVTQAGNVWNWKTPASLIPVSMGTVPIPAMVVLGASSVFAKKDTQVNMAGFSLFSL